MSVAINFYVAVAFNIPHFSHVICSGPNGVVSGSWFSWQLAELLPR